jgi:rubredoxin
MPWTCPACGTIVPHREETVGQRVTYRCSVCRLELVADVDSSEMTVAPLPPDMHAAPSDRTLEPLPTEAHDTRPSLKKKSSKPR